MFPKRVIWLSLGVCLWQLAAGLPSGRAASSGSNSGTLDVNFFYDNLKDDGSWFNTTEYGDVWQPYIAYKNDTWRPYTDGYWSYTDGGWMFVSYENFGWAVYHYGRWTQLKDIGWAWVPGTEWAPAWVTWRESKPDGAEGQPPAGDNGQPAANVAATTTDADDKGTPPPPAPTSAQGSSSSGGTVSQNYIGWAPLPPDPGPPVYDASFAYGPTVDVDYGIDPYDYCFTDVRYFGAPFVGAVIFDPFRSYECCERSVNVTNFYYNNQGGYRGFYNGGPRYERFNGVTQNPIPRYNLRREQGRAAQQAVRSGQFNQINKNTLNVAAPRFSNRNVTNGRVNFKNRGALPVTQVNRDRPGNPANNEARQRARETFRQQGEAFRAQNPNGPGARRAVAQGATGNPGIATTPRAQQEERQARQEATREGPARNPAEGPQAGAAPGNPAAAAAATGNKPQTRSERRAAQREARRQASAANAGARGGDNGAAGAAREQAQQSRRSARQGGGGEGRRERQSSAPRVRSSGGGHGGGGAPRGGGGGGQGRGGGGGGGHKEGGGGGGHKEGGGKKK